MAPLPTLTPEQRTRLVTVLMDLVRTGDTAELTSYLDHGVPADTRDHHGNTLLMMAAYHGQLETVTLLLARGANPNACNHNGHAPVAGAVFRGEREVVALLRSAGADLDLGTPSAREAAAYFSQSL